MTFNQFAQIILLDYVQGDPSLLGAMRYDGSVFRQKDSAGVFNPRTVWQMPHTTLPSLPHIVGDWAGSAAVCVTDGTPFPMSQVWYYDQAQTKKAATVTLQRLSGSKAVSQIITTIFDTDGTTILGTCTENITYSGLFPVRMSRSWSQAQVP